MTSKHTSQQPNASHVGRTITMRPSKAQSLIDVLNSEKHIGNTINVCDRMRWVRKTGVDEDDIVWWPGLLYQGFLELMVDLDYRLSELRAGCLVQHNRTKSTKPTVVYILGTTPPLARSIAYIPTPDCSDGFGMDEEGRDGPDIKNFYDMYEEMTRRAQTAKRASKETRTKFEKCVEFAERILSGAESPGLGMGMGDHDGDVGGVWRIESGGDGVVSGDGGCTTSVVHVQYKMDNCNQKQNRTYSEGADETESRFSLTQRSLTDPPPEITITSGQDGHAKKNYPTTPDTQSSSSSSSTSQSSSSWDSLTSDLSVGNWKNIWNSLSSRGWTSQSASKYNTLHDWYYIRPDVDPGNPKCMLGTDFFKDGSDVLTFLRKNRQAQQQYKKQKKQQQQQQQRKQQQKQQQQRKQKQQQQQSPRSVKRRLSDMDNGVSPMSSVTSQSDDSVAALSFNSETIELINNKDDWVPLWKQLQELGWRWNYGRGLIDEVYIRPGRTNSGKLGEDYFQNKDEVIKYILSRHNSFLPDLNTPKSKANEKRKKGSDVKRNWCKKL